MMSRRRRRSTIRSCVDLHGRRGAGWPQRVGTGEGLDRKARIGDPRHRREGCEIDREKLGARRMACKTNVGDGDRVAVTKASGLLLAAQMRFERVQRLRAPMA